jgi:cellulose biosynthesis protein BcsQ
MPNNQIIAVWGSTGSGKTLTSMKIAKELAERKQNVILVLCDDETPALPLLQPSASDTKSLGDLLSLVDLSQVSVFQHCVPVGTSGYISLLGYQLGETERTYSEYTLRRAKELFSLLRRTNDFVVVDCSHHLMSNILTAAALEVSDVVLKVVNADLKSSIYIRSQQTLLQESRFHYDKQINVLNNVLPTQDTHPYHEALGGASYILPHLPSLKEQYDSGKLLESLFGRDAKKYEPIIKKMVSEVLFDE